MLQQLFHCTFRNHGNKVLLCDISLRSYALTLSEYHEYLSTVLVDTDILACNSLNSQLPHCEGCMSYMVFVGNTKGQILYDSYKCMMTLNGNSCSATITLQSIRYW